MEKIAKGEKLTLEQVLISLQANGIFEEIDLKEQTGICEGYVIKLGYNENGKVVILEMDKDVGTRIEVALNPKGYTNGKIEVTVTVKGAKVTNLEVPTGMTLKQDNIYEIEKNGTYLVKAMLENGETLEKEIKIANIDKKAPKEFTIEATNIKETGFTIIAEAQDSEADGENVSSGIEKYEYYIKKSTDATYPETPYTDKQITGLGIGTYKVYAIAYDRAGNKTNSMEIEVKVTIKIEKVAINEKNYFLAIDTSGNLWSSEYSSLKPLMEGTKFKEIATNYGANLAIDTSGNLWVWGNNRYGQLGNGTKEAQSTPVKIAEGTKFSKISIGDTHSFAIDETGALWGFGGAGTRFEELGSDCPGGSTVPVRLLEGKTIIQAVAGTYASFVIDSEGRLSAWGNNSDMQLGDASWNEGNIVKQISSKNYNVKAIDKDGNLWSWGSKDNGQLGNGTSTPIKLKAGTIFNQVSANGDHILALDKEGKIWVWGDNSKGQLGDGTTSERLSPVQIMENKTFKQVSAGYEISLAIDTEGNLWIWGNGKKVPELAF